MTMPMKHLPVAMLPPKKRLKPTAVVLTRLVMKISQDPRLTINTGYNRSNFRLIIMKFHFGFANPFKVT